MFKEKMVKILMRKKTADIVAKLLEEEKLSLNEDTVFKALMFRYGSVNRKHAWQIMNLYSGTWDLRRTARAVAEQYYDHKQPEIKRLIYFIEWLEKHLEGIPFSAEWDMKSGDYDPTRPLEQLFSMYYLFERYVEEGEQIDSIHRDASFGDYFAGVSEGEEGISQVITSHELYNLYKNGYFQDQAEAIKQELESPDITPSKVLNMLRENWEFYTTPSTFRNMNKCIEYCICCAAEFPDNPEARREFRHAVQEIHLPVESE